MSCSPAGTQKGDFISSDTMALSSPLSDDVQGSPTVFKPRWEGVLEYYRVGRLRMGVSRNKNFEQRSNSVSRVLSMVMMLFLVGEGVRS